MVQRKEREIQLLNLKLLYEGCEEEVLRTRAVLARNELQMTDAEKAERDRRLGEIFSSGEATS